MCKNTNIDRSILRHKIGFMQVQPLFCRHAAQTDPIEYNILYVRDAFYKKIPHARAPLRLHGEAVRADGKGVIVFLRIRPVPATGCREHRLRQDERLVVMLLPNSRDSLSSTENSAPAAT